jgi:hypothetical protein
MPPGQMWSEPVNFHSTISVWPITGTPCVAGHRDAVIGGSGFAGQPAGGGRPRRGPQRVEELARMLGGAEGPIPPRRP